MMKKFNFNAQLCANEREVESKLIVSYLLPALGYSIDSWRQEKKFNRFRLDFLATAQQGDMQHSVIIEVKHPDKHLNDCFEQLYEYMLEINIKYGLLTNGRELRIYKENNNKINLVFSCFVSQLEEKINEVKALIGKQSLSLSYHFSQPYRGSHQMKIIAIYHNKGGVGKTTTVVNLAAVLSKQGKKVLIIDMDSQANSTFATGLINFGDEEKDNLRDCNIYHVLRWKQMHSIKEVVKKARFSSHPVDIIPSHIELMTQENELNQLDYTRGVLRKKLMVVQNDYDIVLIDTPPSLNLYARIALVTTDYLLIPSDLKPFANEGLRNVKEFVDDTDYNREMISLPPIQIIGVLPTKISTNAGFVKSTLQNRIDMVKTRYQIEVLRDYIIYDREDLAKCVEQTLNVGELEISDPRAVSDYKPSSKSVDEFEKLGHFISKKIGLAV